MTQKSTFSAFISFKLNLLLTSHAFAQTMQAINQAAMLAISTGTPGAIVEVTVTLVM